MYNDREEISQLLNVGFENNGSLPLILDRRIKSKCMEVANAGDTIKKSHKLATVVNKDKLVNGLKDISVMKLMDIEVVSALNLEDKDMISYARYSIEKLREIEPNLRIYYDKFDMMLTNALIDKDYQQTNVDLAIDFKNFEDNLKLHVSTNLDNEYVYTLGSAYGGSKRIFIIIDIIREYGDLLDSLTATSDLYKGILDKSNQLNLEEYSHNLVKVIGEATYSVSNIVKYTNHHISIMNEIIRNVTSTIENISKLTKSL